VEKNESGTGILPIVARVREPPHSELVARRMNIEIFRRYTAMLIHSAYDAPSTDLCGHKEARELFCQYFRHLLLSDLFQKLPIIHIILIWHIGPDPPVC
jgi:hypothetical protein